MEDLTTPCTPIVTMKDLGISTSVNGNVLSEDSPADPCGLIAKSFFNDTFTLYPPSSNTPITILSDGIAWPSDRNNKFKNTGDDW